MEENEQESERLESMSYERICQRDIFLGEEKTQGETGSLSSTI